MTAAIEVSVVVPVYRPADGLARVLDSLDAQTMPQERFEVVAVDDGSGDGTFERLLEQAARRPNLRVHRIEASGWPSRPRNVGTDLARGRWVFYLDQDDSLYPDAIRRMAEYAAETGADVVSVRESQTKAVWANTASFRDGNLADVLPSGEINRLMPMVPHKLYRRSFLAEHGIRFEEGRRRLWEDIVFNVAAWRHAGAVAVLADTPVYLWQESGVNNSRTYGPEGAEFWDRLDALCAFIDETLTAPGFEAARTAQLLHQARSRALGRFAQLVGDVGDGDVVEAARSRLLALVDRWVPPEEEPALGLVATPHLALVRAGRTDLLQGLRLQEQGWRAEATATAAEWRDGVLELRLEARLVDADGAPVAVRRSGDRLLRVPQAGEAAAVADGALDVTGLLERFEVRVAVHSRADRTTWEAPLEGAARWLPTGADTVTPVVAATARIDPSRLAGGRPLASSLWILTAMVHWSDVSRSCRIRMRTASVPAIAGGRPVILYAERGALALDLDGSARNVVGDGGLQHGASGRLRALALPLPRVVGEGRGEVPVTILLEDERTGRTAEVSAAIRSDSGRAVLRASGTVPAGRYRLGFRHATGIPRYGRWRGRVSRSGVLRLADSSRPAPARTGLRGSPAARGLRALGRRLVRVPLVGGAVGAVVRRARGSRERR